jgi:tetraacyldisaccharide 4'-kinase
LLGFLRLGGDGALLSTPEIGVGPFFAFCGIGNPQAFLRDLNRWEITPAEQMFFADHHRYTLDDVRAIEQSAARAGAKALLTTEKDSWNLADVKFAELPVYVSIIDLQIAGESEFLAAISHVLQTRGARA